jgi:NMD protein affecting ribosome stability and mRNA decay
MNKGMFFFVILSAISGAARNEVEVCVQCGALHNNRRWNLE